MKNLQETKFTTAERVDSANIPISTELLLRSAVLDHLLETIPCILLILNEERQVMFGTGVCSTRSAFHLAQRY